GGRGGGRGGVESKGTRGGRADPPRRADFATIGEGRLVPPHRSPMPIGPIPEHCLTRPTGWGSLGHGALRNGFGRGNSESPDVGLPLAVCFAPSHGGSWGIMGAHRGSGVDHGGKPFRASRQWPLRCSLAHFDDSGFGRSALSSWSIGGPSPLFYRPPQFFLLPPSA